MLNATAFTRSIGPRLVRALGACALAAGLAVAPAEADWTTAPRTFVVLRERGPEAVRAFADRLDAAGGHASVVYADGAAVVYADDATLVHAQVAPVIAGIHRAQLEETAIATLDAATAEIARAWNFARTLETLDAALPRDEPGDHGPPFPDAGPRPVPLPPAPLVEVLDVQTHLPYGAEYYDTSEFMAGSVAVGVWLLEDPGSTYDWSAAEITQTQGGVQAGLDNWVRKGGAPASLTFFIENHTGAMVSGTPIANPMSWDQTWVDQVLGNAGWPGADAFAKCFAYNTSIRNAFATQWCYSIFIADSNPTVNQGLFSGGGYAWAYYGGPWIYMSRYSTWAYNYPRYYAVVPMHETGHIFMATDEYNGTVQYGGYLNVPDNDYVQCIMNQNDSTQVCTASRHQLAWRDLDADGVIEPLDVPPAAALAPALPDPTSDPTPTWTGRAAVATLDNLNPISNYFPPHDQTIARIAAVECRADGGSWSAASPSDGAFDAYGEDFVWTPSAGLQVGGHWIEARARTTVGIWSTVYGGDSLYVVGEVGVEPGVRAGTGFALLLPHPNPTRGAVRFRFTLPQMGGLRIRLVGVDGRPVRTLVDGVCPAGPGDVHWDGHDDAGRAVPPGLYFVTADGGAGRLARKIAVVR